jgi:hypothetical protein
VDFNRRLSFHIILNTKRLYPQRHISVSYTTTPVPEVTIDIRNCVRIQLQLRQSLFKFHISIYVFLALLLDMGAGCMVVVKTL